MDDNGTMLPIVTNQVAPWFRSYGATLTDKASFRLMIGLAEDDVKSLEALLPEYKRSAPDVYIDCVVDLAIADDLIAAMRKRLAELEASN
jgi:hypothetical protein